MRPGKRSDRITYTLDRFRVRTSPPTDRRPLSVDLETKTKHSASATLANEISEDGYDDFGRKIVS